LVGWDQETYMPPRAQARRAEQLALLSELRHRRFTDPRMGELLEALPEPEVRETLGEVAAANVRETARSYRRATCLPSSFVAELTRVCAHAHEAWIEARKNADFAQFAPHLERIVALKREEADRVGFEDERYDALLDVYEPGARTREIAPMLASLRERLVPIVQRVADGTEAQDGAEDGRRWPVEQQKQLCRRVAAAMGFDFEAGRLDESAHPFCSGIDVGDVRLTTRYDERDAAGALFGVMHETGHGLYEQGLDPERFGTPAGEACSTGMHESQSRLWENQIGRSRPFWEHFFPILCATFPQASEGLDLESWVRRINRVRRSLIRVEADEVTYNLHILLRFELERDLLEQRLAVADLPAAWNAKMEAYLGLTPPDDAQGVLQDIHWSFGGFGYFPTYTLGNLYAAQIHDALRAAFPDLDDMLRHGRLLEIRDWLRDKIHRRGMVLRAPALLEEVTGAPPSAEPFLRYIERKVEALA
ncbi:MAG: carboxypeptidase M32, partial [Planctomycetota bacterium]